MHIDDRGAGTLLCEHRRERAGEKERAEKVGLDIRPNLRIGMTQDAGCRRRDSSIVDQHCHVRCGVDNGPDRVGIGDIEGEWDDALVIPGPRSACGGVDLCGAASERFAHEMRADSAIGSGDENDGSIE